jgi:hypothetical protein
VGPTELCCLPHSRSLPLVEPTRDARAPTLPTPPPPPHPCRRRRPSPAPSHPIAAASHQNPPIRRLELVRGILTGASDDLDLALAACSMVAVVVFVETGVTTKPEAGSTCPSPESASAHLESRLLKRERRPNQTPRCRRRRFKGGGRCWMLDYGGAQSHAAGHREGRHTLHRPRLRRHQRHPTRSSSTSTTMGSYMTSCFQAGSRRPVAQRAGGRDRRWQR